MKEIERHTRVADIMLGPLERPALRWLAAHMPVWINPDILTIIGIFGALTVFAGYALTNRDSAFLWLVNLGLVVNWFGDSLDGTLARHRRIERPRYGFFVDHTVDAFSQVLISLGLGLSPYVRFEIATLALVGYLLMSILAYVDTCVSGEFRISYGKIGPTEIRLIVILLNSYTYFQGDPTLTLLSVRIGLFDLVVAIVAVLLFGAFVAFTTRKALELSRIGEQGMIGE